jgi:hypothetical protein
MHRHPLSPGGNTLVIFDTCVLLPSRLSDVLFDAAPHRTGRKRPTDTVLAAS